MNAPHLRRGQRAEERARAHLEVRGLRFLRQNYRTSAGEIDLVMLDGDTLVFVEVRFRKSAQFGGAAESVTLQKQSRILAAAGHYLAHYPADAGRPCRFDVVAITGQHLEWLRGAFDSR